VIDNVNFAQQTIWEGDLKEGSPFQFHPGKQPGLQHVAEGSDLHMIPSAKYDFVLSSHMLEHCANPLRTLHEWRRVLKPGGSLILVVPHRDGTFDHRRPLTSLTHLIEDLERGTGEDDLTHVEEVLRLHDSTLDPELHGMTMRERAAKNLQLRSVHHHVFDTRLVVDMVQHVGLAVSSVEPVLPYHVIVIAGKPAGKQPPGKFPENALRVVLQTSPFETDRRQS
jgi:SAM-dependent methyltransferase